MTSPTPRTRSEIDPQRLLAAHQLANEFYRSHLLDEPRALAYLRSRGVIAATAHAAPWTIGYAPRGWTVLRDHLYSHDFTEPELLAAGLVTTSRNGTVIDTFRDRVMFPMRNSDGQVVAFTGRDLSGRPDVPKYRNTTTTAIYRKRELLYGLAEQFDAHTEPAAVLLVEGPADVVAVARMRISLSHSDYPDPLYAVAPCGTALTAQQVTLLAGAIPPGTPIVAAFDADTAGANAIDKSYTLLRDWPGTVDAMALPAGADPASLVASGPATALAQFHEARTPLVDLLVEHRLAPHLTRLETRLEELARFDRDPSTESLAIRLEALRTVAGLLTEVADRDQPHAAGLAMHVATRLQLDPLTVFEAMYPPPDEPDTADRDSDAPESDDPDSHAEPADQQATSKPAQDGRNGDPLAGAGFPDPTTVGHQYAGACPDDAPAGTWVAHDVNTGHSAWVLAEGVSDSPADRLAARLAAQVAGRVAVLVGAHQAVEIARTALDAHFAARPGSAQGDATICVLTSFDGDHPQPDRGRFTVAWVGDTRAYAAGGRWFTPLTVDHTLREHANHPNQRYRAAVALLSAPVRQPATAAGPREQRIVAQTTDPGWLASADLYDLAVTWSTAQTFRDELASAGVAADTVEQRLRQLHPEMMARYDEAVREGTRRQDAMQTAARYLPDALRRAGDGALTSSVRGGPIGVNRIDLPTTQILLTGRGMREADPRRLREAVVDHHRPATAIGNLRRLAGDRTVAVVVQPRPDRARDAMTAARLARQDQACGVGVRQAPPLALPTRAHRASPASAPATTAPTR
jgi:DNA primase catalytic core